MADIVITEFMDDEVARTLALEQDVLYDPSLVDRPGDLAAAARDASALIVRNRTRVDEPLLAQCRKLKVIGRLGVGLERIDLDACRRHGVEVCAAHGANAIAVAEYVIAGVLMLRRGAYQATQQVMAGAWPREALIGGEVSGRRLGLVGFGDIARHVARRADALGMEVVAFDPFVHAEDPSWRELGVTSLTFEDVLETSDALSLHVPLTSETRHLLDRAAFDRMQRGAILVNTTRGGVVDEPAMIDALRDGRLSGAMIDVFATEPLPAGVGALYSGIPNLILTPHIAGVSRESNRWLSVLTVNNVLEVLAKASD
ncbi:MAG: hydroxyacid dehydrogenase [Betaproteobacteria bacterium]|nr:hydroxyacid dehydrogenase [Betaproteobacteria bacterium]